MELSEKAVSSADILEGFCLELKKLGVRISIDDFGVKNSNLDRLSLLEYDEIKIYKSLVDGINEHYKQNIFAIFAMRLPGSTKRSFSKGWKVKPSIVLLRTGILTL